MKLLLGDCLDKLKELEDNSVDSIVTDPPYGLSFMGKQWDYDVPSVDIWKECLRVLKPGGHLLAFAGSRTYHRMAVRIEDAGFEIRDMISWLYGSGFPKSHNIGKSVDKIQGNERIPYERPDFVARSNKTEQRDSQVPSGEKGKYTKGNSPYEGWGTALKPAHEPVVMARKPLEENTVVDNVLKWGTGGINIDESRISTDETITNHSRSAESAVSKGKYGDSKEQETHQTDGQKMGRFPANLILDEEAGEMLDEQTGILNSGFMKAGTARLMSDNPNKNTYGKWNPDTVANDTYGDSGGASRFFYCPKVSKSERNEGLTLPNPHPTLKPIDLMLYLIRLVTPKGGVTLDPFMGSGSSGKAAVRGGFDFIGIEREEEYYQIAEARINWEINKPTPKSTKTKKVEVKKKVEEKVNQFFG